jgi:NTE family protein
MKIGLALGGGAARGFAHIGVIDTLLEAGIDIHCIAGTSMGALVGAGFCSGNYDRFKAVVKDISLPDIPGLLSPTVSKNGFFSGKNIIELIHSTLAADSVESMPVPFAAVTVDLINGDPVILTEGSLAEALRCSISIPVVFTPVECRDSIYVDGGIVDPVPVEAARALGADFVIAVDLFGDIGDPTQNRAARKRYQESAGAAELGMAAHYLKKLFGKFGRADDEQGSSEIAGLLEVMERTLAVAQFHATKSRLKAFPPEVLVCPSLGHVGLFDFHRAEDISVVGAESVHGHLPEIFAGIEKIRSRLGEMGGD